ncbi:MAG: hypothetical protein ABI460_04085 [Caldimonas sp.]
MPTPSEDPFEKTVRLVCRLDDAEIDYVRDTAEWITRCVRRILTLNPSASVDEVTTTVLDMSSHGRWRLMKPEIVGDQFSPAIASPHS